MSFKTVMLLSLSFASCSNGSNIITAPDAEPIASKPVAPSFMDGYFSTGKSSAAWPGGSTQVLVPSWSESAESIAADINRNNVFLFVSAHHCFGNKPTTWESCWSKTKTWMAPIEKTGRLIGVYVIDEPLHNGIEYPQIDTALARVRADGYVTMMAETWNRYRVNYRRDGYAPHVDYFGLTGYYDKIEWVLDEYNMNQRLNIVFASSAGGHEWDELARRVHAKGIFRWSLDMGAADNGHRIPRL